MPHGPSFGNKSTLNTSKKRITSECQDKIGGHIVGTFLGRTKASFNNTASGKSEQGTGLISGSWQKEPILNRNEWETLKTDTDSKDLFLVQDFWDHGSNNGKWRKWKDLYYSNESPLKDMVDALTMYLEQRRILVLSQPDQLRWGKNNEGNFNLKEAKEAITGFNFVNTDIV